MRTICFSTGNLYRLVGKKDIYKIINQLDVDGVEIAYGRSYYDRPILEQDFEILKKFDFVSMHSPFKLSTHIVGEKEFNKTIKLIEKDYKKVNAKHVVVHPTQKLTKNLPSLNYITENLAPRKKMLSRKTLFESVLKKEKNFGLCLDVAHAYLWGINETENIVKKWKKRIKSIHFSNTRYNMDHLSFEKVSRDFLKSIEPLRELNVPIIIEEDMKYTKISDIQKEIKRVKEIIF